MGISRHLLVQQRRVWDVLTLSSARVAGARYPCLAPVTSDSMQATEHTQPWWSQQAVHRPQHRPSLAASHSAAGGSLPFSCVHGHDPSRQRRAARHLWACSPQCSTCCSSQAANPHLCHLCMQHCTGRSHDMLHACTQQSPRPWGLLTLQASALTRLPKPQHRTSQPKGAAAPKPHAAVQAAALAHLRRSYLCSGLCHRGQHHVVPAGEHCLHLFRMLGLCSPAQLSKGISSVLTLHPGVWGWHLFLTRIHGL